jgi:enoyl-CoA hydratase/carnithine racemase
MADVTVEVGDDHVATIEIHRPPDNFFDVTLIGELAAALEQVDGDDRCRAAVLCSEGKNFCAGAQLGGRAGAAATGADGGPHLYEEAVRLFSTRTPVVAAVQGAAVGGGLGLALFPDFRVAAPEARFTANFARMGFHHGFGLTVTLPAVVGQQRALEMLYTGRRVKGDEAVAMGLADRLAPLEQVREAAHEMAADIAVSGPLALHSIRETMRGHLAAAVREATARERAEQDRLTVTDDFREGVRAMNERRPPEFTGR